MSIPWICQRCIARAARTVQQRRFQSTAATKSISPALLARARSMSVEHAELSKIVTATYDARRAKRLAELSVVTAALQRWEGADNALRELDSLLRDPRTDPELRALASEDVAPTSTELSKASQALTASLVPRHPFAHMPCLLEIRPGAGGGEAGLFAMDLLKMYLAFCSHRGLRASLLKYEGADGVSASHASEVPLQEAIIEVESSGAYNLLRSEAGVHRVQRVPATETKGRIHTSAASVLVLPSLSGNGRGEEDGDEDWDDPSSDYHIDPKDVRTDVMRARGAGGQHVNTTDSAIRLTHLPTNTVVSMQDSRSQHQNREKAWKLLRSKIAQTRREAREEEMLKMRRSVVGVARVGRGDKVRTYNWSQQRVTDHRSGLSVHNLDDVVAGGESLEKIMESVRVWLGEQDMEAVLADQTSDRGK